MKTIFIKTIHSRGIRLQIEEATTIETIKGLIANHDYVQQNVENINLYLLDEEVADSSQISSFLDDIVFDLLDDSSGNSSPVLRPYPNINPSSESSNSR